MMNMQVEEEIDLEQGIWAPLEACDNHGLLMQLSLLAFRTNQDLD